MRITQKPNKLSINICRPTLCVGVPLIGTGFRQQIVSAYKGTLAGSKIWFVVIGLLCALAGSGRAAETNAPPTIEAQLAAIRAQGYPTSLAELELWRCPAVPGENAAAVNREAFEKMVRPSKEIARALPIDGLAHLPGPGTPLADESLNAIQDYLTTNSAALALLNRAAQLPAAGYRPQISESLLRSMIQSLNKEAALETNNLLVVMLTDLRNTRAAARLLCLETIFAVEEQKPAKAVTALGVVSHLTRPLGCQPNLIKHLVEIAVQSMAFSTLERVINRTTLDDAQLATLDDQLRDEADANALQTTLIGDRAFALGLHKQGPPSGLDTPKSSQALPQQVWQSDRDETAFLDGIEAYIKAAALDYPDRLQAARLIEQQFAISSNSFPTASLALQGIASTFAHDAKYTAQFRIARAVIAVERERLKAAHVLPTTLPAMVLPDPFSGKPLQYKKLASGYVIYSVGENLRGDGGIGKNEIKFTMQR